MAINLTENVKTYLTYAGIAITSAAVGALILLAGQGINNWRHPKVLASAITGDMLRATQGANVEELRTQVDELNRQTPTLTETRDQAQTTVNNAGGGVTDEQQQALARAEAALAEHNKRITNLQAQIAVNDVFDNADQLAVLVDRINHVAPVSQAPAPAPAGEGNQ